MTEKHSWSEYEHIEQYRYVLKCEIEEKACASSTTKDFRYCPYCGGGLEVEEDE